MSGRAVLFVAFVSLLLGVLIVMGLNGPDGFAPRRPVAVLSPAMASSTPVHASPTLRPSSRPPSSPTATLKTASSTPEPTVASTLTPVPTHPATTTAPTFTLIPTTPAPTATLTPPPAQVGSPKGTDVEDVLLLYDRSRPDNFDVNFCSAAQFYGLLCRRVALDSTKLSSETLRDGQGQPYKLVGISARTLLRPDSPVTIQQLGVLKSAVERDGVYLVIGKVDSRSNSALLDRLTDGAITQVTKPKDSHRDWFVASTAPEVTRQFTGQVISETKGLQLDYALTVAQPDVVTMLITSTDDAGTAYPVFAEWRKGAGSVFIDAGEQAESLSLISLSQVYYRSSFTKLAPLMFAMRYAMGDECWHSDHHYANLTLDSLPLAEPAGSLQYAALLGEMKAHDFHTTIAFLPANWDKSQPEVAKLFRANPDRYSLVQYGNNADGYEFYKVAITATEQGRGPEYAARPLSDQEADIVEGLNRLERHRNITGIPYGRVMVFPYGISPEATLVLLKKHNYLGTVNAQDLPLGATRPARWDYGMAPANMDYGNFPTLQGRPISDTGQAASVLQASLFDLFVDKPVLLFSERGQLFASGSDAFGPFAERLNALLGRVEWRSLDDILKRLYLEKRNDDGSVDVRAYTNHVVVANESDGRRVYHLAKEENLNVPIARLTVDGRDFPYQVRDGLLTLDLSILPHSSVEIRIDYESSGSS